jgi:hypothetical protein
VTATEVGEVRHRFESGVELGLGEAPLQRRLLGDERMPIRLGRWITEHVGRHRAERVENARVGLLARRQPRATSIRSIASPGAVEQLDGLGDMERPHGQSDLLARDVTRHAPAVPAGEHLLHLAAHLGAQAETLRHPGRGQTVGTASRSGSPCSRWRRVPPRGRSAAAGEFPTRRCRRAATG